MDDMKTFANKGPRGDPIATPSVCSYRAPLNWNSWPLVATFRRSIRSVLVRARLWVVLNQLFEKALLTKISIVSSKGTFVNNEETSYETKISPLLIFSSWISFVKSKLSVTVYWLRDKGFNFSSSHYRTIRIIVKYHSLFEENTRLRKDWTNWSKD